MFDGHPRKGTWRRPVHIALTGFRQRMLMPLRFPFLIPERGLFRFVRPMALSNQILMRRGSDFILPIVDRWLDRLTAPETEEMLAPLKEQARHAERFNDALQTVYDAVEGLEPNQTIETLQHIRSEASSHRPLIKEAATLILNLLKESGRGV